MTIKNMEYWKSKNSPLQKNGDDDKKIVDPSKALIDNYLVKKGKTPKRQPSENTVIKGGESSSKVERINDLEDRIEFIREDIWNTQKGDANSPTDENQANTQQMKDLQKLRMELKALRKSK